MAVLSKGSGIFSLSESDKNAGSNISLVDLAEIFEVSVEVLSPLPKVLFEGQEFANELDVHKFWHQNLLPGAPPSKIRNANRSLDELIVAALIRRVYPNMEISQQVKWGRRSLDFVLEHPVHGKKILEFHGPSHFAPGRFAREIQDPFVRKAEIEHEFDVECVIWPYWIQRCESNVKAIFEPETPGYGVLWSAQSLFGDFVFPNSAEIIERISERFNATRGGAYGYFYGPDSEGRKNPEHPIVSRIRDGKASTSRLIPQGSRNDATWLPQSLLSLGKD